MRGLRRWSSAAFVGAVAAACAPPPSERAFDEGLQGVDEATRQSLPGSTAASVAGRLSERPPGGGASGGDGNVTGAAVRLARHDWSALLASAEFGPAGLVLSQANLEADALRRHGFEPFDAGYSVFAVSGAPDVASVTLTGNGIGGGWSAPRDVDRLVYRRLYRTPGTGAFVVSRIEYDARTRVAESELTYVEATVPAAYPKFHGGLTETIAAAPRKR